MLAETSAEPTSAGLNFVQDKEIIEDEHCRIEVSPVNAGFEDNDGDVNKEEVIVNGDIEEGRKTEGEPDAKIPTIGEEEHKNVFHPAPTEEETKA